MGANAPNCVMWVQMTPSKGLEETFDLCADQASLHFEVGVFQDEVIR